MKIILFLSLLIPMAQAKTLYLNQYLGRDGNPHGRDFNSIERKIKQHRLGKDVEIIDRLVIRPLKKSNGSKRNPKISTIKRVLFPTLRQFNTLQKYLSLPETKELRLEIETSAWPNTASAKRLSALPREKTDLLILIKNCLSSSSEVKKLKGLTHGHLTTLCPTDKAARNAKELLKTSNITSDLIVHVAGPNSLKTPRTITTPNYPSSSKVKEYKGIGVSKLIVKSDFQTTPATLGDIDFNLSTLVDIPSGGHVTNLNAMKEFAKIEIYPYLSSLPSSSRINRINKLKDHVAVNIYVYENCPDSKREKDKLLGYKRLVSITAECRSDDGFEKAKKNAAEAMAKNDNLSVSIIQVSRAQISN